MNELYGGRPRLPVGGEVYWLRSVPAGARARREGRARVALESDEP